VLGQTISHYRVIERLGEGGMGVVYKALDGRLDRLVALKVLPPQKVADSDRKRRFVKEAKAASALNHPNIITIYDIGSADGIDFIAMEFVAGKTLDRCIPRHGLRLDEALKYSTHVIFHSNIWRTAAPLLDGRPSTGDRESLKLVKSAAPPYLLDSSGLCSSVLTRWQENCVYVKPLGKR